MTGRQRQTRWIAADGILNLQVCCKTPSCRYICTFGLYNTLLQFLAYLSVYMLQNQKSKTNCPTSGHQNSKSNTFIQQTTRETGERQR
jgi:hypothetical protein